MKRSRFAIWAFGLVLAGAAVFARAQGAQGALDGAFAYAGSPEQRMVIERAIAAATSALPEGSRNRWRAQLSLLTRPEPQIALRQNGSEFATRAGGPALRSPLDGSVVAVRGGWELRQRLVDGALEQRIGNGAVTQLYRYSLVDTQTLRVEVSITADALSAPIEFMLEYRRQ